MIILLSDEPGMLKSMNFLLFLCGESKGMTHFVLKTTHSFWECKNLNLRKKEFLKRKTFVWLNIINCVTKLQHIFSDSYSAAHSTWIVKL